MARKPKQLHLILMVHDMNKEILASKTLEIEGFTLTYKLVADYNGYVAIDNFRDQWEFSDSHKGGITIKSNGGNYYIPLQYTLADLTKDYSKGGRDNPSKAAYDSLQQQLDRDIEAYSIDLEYSVTKNEIELEAGYIISSDYSPAYDSGYNHELMLNELLSNAEDDSVYIGYAKEKLLKLIA